MHYESQTEILIILALVR